MGLTSQASHFFSLGPPLHRTPFSPHSLIALIHLWSGIGPSRGWGWGVTARAQGSVHFPSMPSRTAARGLTGSRRLWWRRPPWPLSVRGEGKVER